MQNYKKILKTSPIELLADIHAFSLWLTFPLALIL